MQTREEHKSSAHRLVQATLHAHGYIFIGQFSGALWFVGTAGRILMQHACRMRAGVAVAWANGGHFAAARVWL